MSIDLTCEPLPTNRHQYLPLLDHLAALFRMMDQAYTAVADQYGFRCTGCVDNCCLTRFYHHTLAEYLYLAEGLHSLAAPLRQTVREQAASVCQHMAEADHRGAPPRMMCPLNKQGRCLVYPFRPMICRLHGIPHELRHPGGGIVRHPGCDAFFDQCRESGRTVYIPFDRTPFYSRMAILEKKLRQLTGYNIKIKLTIAQMLVTLPESAYEID